MTKYLNPLDFSCTIYQGFGQNANGYYKSVGLKGHTAIDEACGYGTDVKSYVSGTVYSVYTPENPAYSGYTAVYILCKTPLETFEFSVGHLSEIFVKEGDEVKEGQVIGKEGNKGVVYSGGERITLEMQRRGDRRGSHRHVQKRPVKPVSVLSSNKRYLMTPKGFYQDLEGNYYEIEDYNNGYGGCVDFTKPLFNRNLFVGNRGYDVTLLQKALVQQGHADFEPTGYFGEMTRRAVARYQKAVGLTSLGFFYPKTRKLFNAIYQALT